MEIVVAADRVGVALACGQHKADAVAQAVVGPVTSDVPASAIQLHPNVTVVLDPAASSGLARPLVAPAVAEDLTRRHIEHQRAAGREVAVPNPVRLDNRG